jgi:GR25 family glycosyltransferase involved in LPS biosynthesis|tara:strand:+ start:7340 stop:8077 length:738 start_codon:yes stop_codon:yes gene_type:complete
MMKALVITLTNNYVSNLGSRMLLSSIKDTKSKLETMIVDATTPITLAEDLSKIDYINTTGLEWSWPITEDQDRLDLKTGLYLRHYETSDITKVVACMVSHMRCWQMCIDLDEPIVVLEHDAIFTRKFDFKDLTKDFKGGIIGLNHPKGTTRKAKTFHEKVIVNEGLQPVPSVDESHENPLPQGIAGNSAYVISPNAAKKLLNKTREIGMWPNDAVMCKQFFPWLQVVYPYYTGIQQGLGSTTTGR